MKLSLFTIAARSARLARVPAAVVLSFAAALLPAQTAPAAATPPAGAETRLLLDDAILRALKHNAQIKVTDFGRGIGRANVLAEYGVFDPALTFTRTHSETEAAYTTALGVSPLTKVDDYALFLQGLTPWGLSYQIGGSSEEQRDSSNPFSNAFVTFGGISVTQPLLRGFGFGANLANLRIAKADRSISDWQYRQTLIDTVTNVIIAYTNVAAARENLLIARRSRELAAQLVRDNERRNRVGYTSDADVLQARARVANREESILIAQRQVTELENNLRELMGDRDIAPNSPDFAVAELKPDPLPVPDGAAELKRALELRPDYQMAKQNVLKRQATRALTRNQLLPRVDFVGRFGYNGIDPSFAVSRAQVRSQDHRAYSAGFEVSVPLTFAQGRGRARAAKLALEQSKADLDRLEQDIAVRVANALGELETTAQRVQATTRAYELAQQALDAEEKKFRAGTSSTFLVLQLQEQLVAVQFSQVQAIADQHRAIAIYRQQVGTTLVSRGITVE